MPASTGVVLPRLRDCGARHGRHAERLREDPRPFDATTLLAPVESLGTGGSETSTPPPHDGLDLIRSLHNRLVLPNTYDLPTCRFKSGVGVTVAPHVPLELRDPPLSVCLRHRGVVGAAVPIAPVHVHGDPRSAEHHVGSSAKATDRSDVDSVAEPAAPKLAAQSQLWLRVAPRLAPHPMSDFIRRRMGSLHPSAQATDRPLFMKRT